jgi:hypothetical protein
MRLLVCASERAIGAIVSRRSEYRRQGLAGARETGVGATMRLVSFFILTLLGATLVVGAPSAQALTMKECSAKYQAAKQAGTLQGMTWRDFQKSQCAAGASSTANTNANAAAAPDTGSSKATAPRAAAPATGNAIFPTAVSPKYSNESPGKARMHTCLDQYHANKSNGGNGGLTWIQKGGGYYAECNKRLKG